MGQCQCLARATPVPHTPWVFLDVGIEQHGQRIVNDILYNWLGELNIFEVVPIEGEIDGETLKRLIKLIRDDPVIVRDFGNLSNDNLTQLIIHWSESAKLLQKTKNDIGLEELKKDKLETDIECLNHRVNNLILNK